jgi:hypothetical protein
MCIMNEQQNDVRGGGGSGCDKSYPRDAYQLPHQVSVFCRLQVIFLDVEFLSML